MSPYEIYATLLLLIAAFSFLAIRLRRSKESFAIPKGLPVYSDLKAEGRILRSSRYGLSGKPDKVVQEGSAIIPYEYKSTDANRPREGHMLQMAVYFLILEENFPGSTVEYGVLKYRNCAFRIENSAKLRDELFHVIDGIRSNVGMPDRNHGSPRRCVYCSFRESCSQKLIK